MNASIRQFVQNAFGREEARTVALAAPRRDLLDALKSALKDEKRFQLVTIQGNLSQVQPQLGSGLRPLVLVADMRGDIIVGEVRGEEAFDMLQAMTTGHEGSMTTVHANSPRDATSRMERMVGMAGFPMSEGSIRSQIASAIRIIVQLQRFADGKRRVTSISEITGIDGSVVQMQEIFNFQRNPQGGEFRATGLRPAFADAFREAGRSCRPMPSTRGLRAMGDGFNLGEAGSAVTTGALILIFAPIIWR